ncbi:hypothetical protein [Gordonia sp. NPDC003429]
MDGPRDRQPAPWSYRPPITTGVALTIRKHPVNFGIGMRPYVMVDGWQMPSARWGLNVIPLPPGPHRIYVHIPSLSVNDVGLYKIGRAETWATVYPNRMTELEYRMPLWMYHYRGALGPPPQQYKGVAVFVVANTIGLTLLLLFLVAVIVSLV